jgi:hypothetical protein
MPYELAKELKDAGFPQDKCSSLIYQSNLEHATPAIGLPILEELIAACRPDFDYLKDIGVGYQACSVNNCFVSGEGKTPAIAMAHLWLALNKK